MATQLDGEEWLVWDEVMTKLGVTSEELSNLLSQFPEVEVKYLQEVSPGFVIEVVKDKHTAC